MPFLIVSNQAVPVSVGGASEEFEFVGDRARAFDGSLRSTRRATKRKWKVKTAPMTAGDAALLRGKLLAPPPLSCSGDFLGGPVSCDAELTGVEFVAAAGAERQTIEFILHEV